jgi:hypothetical protein
MTDLSHSPFNGFALSGRWFLKRLAMYLGTGVVAALVFVAGAAFYSFVWPAPPPFVRLLVDPVETDPVPDSVLDEPLMTVRADPTDFHGAPVLVSGHLFGTVDAINDFDKPSSSVVISVSPQAGDFLTFDPPEVPKSIMLPFNLLEWHRDSKSTRKLVARFRFETQKDGVLTTLAKDVSPKPSEKEGQKEGR